MGDSPSFTTTLLTVLSEEPTVVATLEASVADHHGCIVQTGTGRAAMFARAADAVDAARALQQRLGEVGLGELERPAVMVHTGDAAVHDQMLIGPVVLRSAQLAAAAPRGHVTLSTATRAVIDDLPADATVEIGILRRRDAATGERLHVVTQPGVGSLGRPPLAASLPVPISRFVGRRAELEQLAARLPTNRLVTVTGAGGMGKTRLAIELARRLAPRFGGAVALAELATATSTADVDREVAGALGLAVSPAADGVGTAADRIGNDRWLLVLDDCDRALDAVASAAVRLLARCPELTVLATSRERLGIAGEQVWPLPPLSLEGGTASEAVELFLDRAAGARPDLVVDERTRSDAHTICARLDAIPLALELAAAQVATVGLADLADVEPQRLCSSDRTAPARHRSLAAAIDWSHERLSPEERLVFCRSSVFTGSFDLAAADGALGGGGLDACHIAPALHSLAAKSLLVAEPDVGRFHLLATIREYAHDRLVERGEVERVNARLVEDLASWCERQGQRLEQPGALDALDAIASRHDDILGALEHADDPEQHARIAVATTLYWLLRGQESIGRHHLMRAASDERVSRDLRSRCHVGAGLIAARQWDPSGAAEHGLAALADGDAGVEGRARLAVGWSCIYRGDSAGARDALEPVLAMAGDPIARAGSLAALAMVPFGIGDWPAARSLFAASLAEARRCDQVLFVLDDLMFLAWLAWLAGDDGEAGSAADEGAAIAAVLGDAMHESACTAWMALLAIRRGEFDLADRQLDHALEVASRSHSPFPMLIRALVSLHRGWWSDSVTPLLAEATRFGEFTEAMGEGALAPLGYGLAARAAVACDEPSVAVQLLERAERVDHHGEPQVALARSEVAAARGEIARAEELAHAALDAARQRSTTVVALEAIEQLALLRAVSGDNRRAGRLVLGADASWRTHGWVRPAHRAATLAALPRDDGERTLTEPELHAFATRARGARSRPTVGWDALTPTELAVAELAVTGATNSEVGEQLLMGAETVKTHLSRVYAKLAVRGRVELASVMADRGAR